MKTSRRNFAALVPILCAPLASAQSSSAAKPPLASKTYAFDELPVKTNGANRSRAIMNGLTHESFPFEMHMTELGPGQAPHPPHQHAHEEIVIIKEGMLDVTINGVRSQAGPGSVIYAASGDLHGWVNNTGSRTSYYVIAVGHDS